ncbi:MAG: cytidine deaminase [Prevotellaceae bacterium]|jgi:cytidine deaminase|nr:cytidine deaminase [Prevotellaceae bacterium]
MKEYEIRVKVKEYANKSELPADEQQLLQKSEEATRTSYAPYSNFNVGVAILLENGEIIRGSNQENSASPSGLCAERVAMFYANAQYPNVAIIALAVSSSINGILNSKPIYPCGSCRQSLLENEQRFGKSIKVIMGSTDHIQAVNSIKDLLPLSFDLDDYK